MGSKGLWIVVVLLVCVAGASAGIYLGLSGGEKTTATTEAEAAAGPAAAAGNAAAKALVRNAMTAIESAFVSAMTFDPAAVSPDVLKAFEPSITFVAGRGNSAATAPTAQEADQAVNYFGTDLAYAVGTVSTSGTTFGVVVDKGPGGGVKYYVGGRVQAW